MRNKLILILSFLIINNAFSYKKYFVEKVKTNGGENGYDVVTESDWESNGTGEAKTYSKTVICKDPGTNECIYTQALPTMAFEGIDNNVVNNIFDNFILNVESTYNSNPSGFINIVQMIAVPKLDGTYEILKFSGVLNSSNNLEFSIEQF